MNFCKQIFFNETKFQDMETSRAVTSETIAGSRHLPNSYQHPPRPNPPPAPRPIVRSKAERSGLTLTNTNYVATPEPPSPYSSSIAQHHYIEEGGRQLAVAAGGGAASRVVAVDHHRQEVPHQATVRGVPDHRQHHQFSRSAKLAKRSASPDDLSLYSPRTSRSHTPDDLFCAPSLPPPPHLRSQLPRSAGADRLASQTPRVGAIGNGNGGVTPADDDRYGTDWRHQHFSRAISPGDLRLLHHNGENSKIGDQKDRYFPPDSPVRDYPASNGRHSIQVTTAAAISKPSRHTTDKKFTKTRKKVTRQQSSDYNSDHDNSSWESRHAVDLVCIPVAHHPATLQASHPPSTTTNHKDWQRDRSPGGKGPSQGSSSGGGPQRLRPYSKGVSKSSGASPVDPTSDFSEYMLPSENTGAIPKKRTRPLADDLPSPNHPDAIIALPLDDNTPTSSVSTSRNYNNYAHS